MQVDDLILVSVDDHVVEPPHLFEGRLSARAAELAPKLVHLESGREVWMFEGAPLPNVGLNAVVGRVPEEYGLDPLAFDQMRPGCFDIHERIPAAPSGIYLIDPDGDGGEAPFRARCDMETRGGGWKAPGPTSNSHCTSSRGASITVSRP